MTTIIRYGTTVMESGGLYSEHNPNSFCTVDRLLPIVCKAAASTDYLEGDSVFTYIAFGAADGGVGSVLAKAVVDRVKSINKAKPIHIVFEDQSQNDFSPILTKHQQTNTHGFEDVFVSVIGRSFYKQCAPSDSV